jgi:hypothetical protein
MNDRKGVPDADGSVPVCQHAGAVHITPELREGEVGDWGQATAPAAQETLRAILCAAANRASCAQEASRCGATQADMEHRTGPSIDSGRREPMHGRLKPTPSATSPGVHHAALKSALRKERTELWSYRRAAHTQLGPFAQVEEEIREEPETTISRFCVLPGTPHRNCSCRLKPQRSADPPSNEHDSTSATSTCARLVEGYAAKHPSYGYRQIHELMIADGHVVSAPTVRRAIQVSQRRPERPKTPERSQHTTTQADSTPAPGNSPARPASYVPGPFNPNELATALALAHTVATDDYGHDIQAVFDIMNAHHSAGLDQDQRKQIARAVLHFLCGIGALDTRDTIRALNVWHLKNHHKRSVLAWAITETLQNLRPASHTT